LHLKRLFYNENPQTYAALPQKMQTARFTKLMVSAHRLRNLMPRISNAVHTLNLHLRCLP
jgi:hypothetical protein